MMKKYLWSISAALLLMIAACGKTDEAQKAADTPAESSAATHAPADGASNSTDSASDEEGFSTPLDLPDYQDMPTYSVNVKDGELLPPVLVVPAQTKFRILVKNIGTKPAEFESNSLRQEKVLYMGVQSTMVVMPLDPGEYDYYDDFTPGKQGKIVAKKAG